MKDRWDTGRIEAFSDGVFSVAAFLAPKVAAFAFLAIAVFAIVHVRQRPRSAGPG